MSQESDALRRAIAAAKTGREQNDLAQALAAHDRAAAAAKAEAADLDWGATAVAATLAPVAVHSVHTAATDWLGDIAEGVPDLSQRLIAEASLWYTRLPEAVRADTEEFTAQAHGAAIRTAGRLHVHPAAVTPQFMDYVHFVRKQSGSGLPEVQQTIDANNAPAATPLPPQVFDNFAPEVADVNAGVSGTETSTRAPLLQEIMGGGGAPAAPSATAPPTAQTMPATGAPDLGDQADGAGDGEAEEDDGPLTRATAVNHTFTLDDYLARTAAVGEDGLYDTDEDFHTGADDARDMWHEEQRRRAELPSRTRPPVDYSHQRYLDDVAEYGQDFADRAHHGPARRAEHGPRHDDWERDASGAILAARTHTGASGLDQIQQTTAPDGVTAHPTALPEDVAFPWIISPNAENDAPPADGEMASDGDGDDDHDYRNVGTSAHAARRVEADQWHGQEWPHAAVQPDAANNPATTPAAPVGDYGAGHAAGSADRRANDTAPTYADASSAAPDYVRGYTDGYGAAASGDSAPAVDMSIPSSLTGPPAPRRLSHLLSTPDERARPDYAAGYAAGIGWKAGTANVPKFGGDEYEAGLYAGILDNPAAQPAFTARHRHAADKGVTGAGRRIARHASASAAFSGAPQLPATVRVVGPYLAHTLTATAGTSTDLDTMAPGTSADPAGATPFNGPGRPGPLDGQYGAADPGGPAPYNGAEPYGTPAVPAASSPPGAPVLVPDTGMTAPTRATAFRRLVQANLARTASGAPLLTPTNGSL